MRKHNKVDLRIMVEGAKRYAMADASDPFAFGRAMAHLRSGVAEYSDAQGESAYYDAEMSTEPRSIPLPNGQTLDWDATVWKNRSRP